MFKHFLRYFVGYIFHSKTRQRLILIAITGLFLSSFALLVLDSVMGGLQKGLIERSKQVEGEFVIQITQDHETLGTKLQAELTTLEIPYYAEYEIELLARQGQHLTPIILHGVDLQNEPPPFLKEKDLKGVVLGADLGVKLGADFYSSVQFISPAHVDSFLGDVPRQVSAKVSDFYLSELGEIDAFNAWVRLPLVQNLIRANKINKVRIYDREYLPIIENLIANEFPESVRIKTWEQVHQALVWSLNLETKVMLILFICMTFLIAITITSGYMIFFDKIKRDLASFWILGSSREDIMKLSRYLCHAVSFVTCALGVVCALGFLWVLDNYGIEVMPDVFVERKIPVNISWQGISIALIVPYVISVIFSYFSVSYFKKENHSFLNIIRNVG
jgi:lipoprotein-releasing system permease protein